MIYIECTVMFDFLDLVHHVLEHEEEESHKNSTMPVEHDDKAHEQETALYISIFSLFRLAIYLGFMYWE